MDLGRSLGAELKSPCVFKPEDLIMEYHEPSLALEWVRGDMSAKAPSMYTVTGSLEKCMMNVAATNRNYKEILLTGIQPPTKLVQNTQKDACK